MKTVSAATMKELDRRAIQEFEIPGTVLMERAGVGVAEVVQRLARTARTPRPLVQLFAGKGNNGGDAFVAARYLANQEMDVQVFLAGEIDAIRGDALEHLLKLKAANVALEELSEVEDWVDLGASPFAAGDILVDGLLGTGITGPARGLPAAAIQVINRFSQFGYVVSIDVPSGLNSDTGTAAGDVVVADRTVTMALPKDGIVQPSALPYVGNVDVVDIGMPAALTEDLSGDMELITALDVHRLLPRRARDAHKGQFGHVLLIGGSPGLTGAMTLATRAACRSGVGLVTALVPQALVSVVATSVPEAMVHGGKETEDGYLDGKALVPWFRELDNFDAILIGPGLGQTQSTGALLQSILTRVTNPVVLDADALNLVSGNSSLLRATRAPLVLTPHPGEMARLIGRNVDAVQSDRFDAARAAVGQLKGTLVLKGGGTIVAAPGTPLYVNLTGNPGMACGGMGDVLAGFLTGLIGHGLAPIDAARAAVYVHGLAGDSVAAFTSQMALTAGDVIEELPHVLRDVSSR